ncbi:hypothetical protein L204_104253 [Cryptococcus depauperatus]|nr:hypothetical protein L204_04922 [Cryptococcus depauperatus CBS 7855]
MSRSESKSRSKSRSRSAKPLSRSQSPLPGRRSASPATQSQEISPYLIRIYVTKGKHLSLHEFERGDLPRQDEFQVYGWKNTTPSEIIRLLFASFPANYRAPSARFHFRHVYVDASPRGLYRFKDLVAFTGRDLFFSNQDKPDMMDIDLDDRDKRMGKKIEEKTLDWYGFIAGDLLSVSLHVPEPRQPASGVNNGHGTTVGSTFRPNGPGGPNSRGMRNGPMASFDSRSDRVPQGDDASGEGVDAPRWSRGAPLPPQDRSRMGTGRFDKNRESGRLGSGRWKRSSPERDDKRNRSKSPRRDRRESHGRRD